MGTILWVDDDLDDFPAVRRAIVKTEEQLKPAYSIREAVDWLKEGSEPSAVILDAYTPLGGYVVKSDNHGSSSGEPPRRYTGLLLLAEFPALKRRTIFLTIVPKDNLIQAGLDPAVKFFSKLDLGPHLEDFKKDLEQLVTA